MRLVRFVLSLLLVLCFSPRVNSQQAVATPQRDPQAIAVVTQALITAGGASAIGAVQDFAASGSITYFWAGQEHAGPATIRGRGVDEFRVDAHLPEGTQSWAVVHEQGSMKQPDGRIYTIPSQNALNLGALTFPHLKLAAALNNALVSVQYAGVVSLNRHQAYVIHLHRPLSRAADAIGIIGQMRAADFLIDATTYEILLVRDGIYPADGVTQALVHEIEFTDYRLSNGLLTPFSITERVNGQRTWIIRINSMNFNAGLAVSDFQLQ